MFLRISPDEYINTDEIQHIKVVDSMNCLLSTESGIYTSQMPVETLLAIIRNEAPANDNNKEVLEQISNKIGELPVFAG